MFGTIDRICENAVLDENPILDLADVIAAKQHCLAMLLRTDRLPHRCFALKESAEMNGKIVGDAKDAYYEWLSSDAVWGQCFGDNAPDNLGGALCYF